MGDEVAMMGGVLCSLCAGSVAAVIAWRGCA